MSFTCQHDYWLKLRIVHNSIKYRRPRTHVGFFFTLPGTQDIMNICWINISSFNNNVIQIICCYHKISNSYHYRKYGQLEQIERENKTKQKQNKTTTKKLPINLYPETTISCLYFSRCFAIDSYISNDLYVFLYYICIHMYIYFKILFTMFSYHYQL